MGEKIQKDYPNNAVINVGSVSKAFGSKAVLNNINLDIAGGQSICICGANGAGKSTLLGIIVGLLQPDKGAVHLCGYNINEDPEKTKPQVGLISHKSMVYPDLTVLENLFFFARLYGIKDVAARVNKLIEDAGLFPYRYDKTSVLSRGLLQRLSIARALVHQPQVLLADEPFTGLDRDACERLVNVLNDFTKNNGTTVMTTHDINTGMRCCSRVVVLDKGGLIFDAMTSNINTVSFAQDYLTYARNKN